MLKKNPNYTGDRPAYADEIDYTQLTIDPNQGTLEAKNGELDYINDAVVPAQNAQLNAQYGPNGTAGGPQRFFVTPAAVVSYLALNTARPTFKDELVRQAVNWAINRKEILQPSGYGAGVPADKYLPPQISGSSEEQSIYPLDSADLTKAKALMQQAGASNLTAVLYTCNQPPCPDRAAIIQNELKQIGIDVQIKEFDRGVQFTKEGQKGEPFDIADEGWIADYYDAYDFINILLNGETIPDTGGNNFSYFNDPTFNKRMDDANQLTGSAARSDVRPACDRPRQGAGAVGVPVVRHEHRLLRAEDRMPGEPGLLRVRPEHLLHPLIATGGLPALEWAGARGNPRGGASRHRPGSPEPPDRREDEA